MQNTVTIQRTSKTVQSTAVDLPAYFSALDGSSLVAIFSEHLSISVFTVPDLETIRIGGIHLHEDAVQCSESIFVQAYQRAMLAIEQKFLDACPSIVAPAVYASETSCHENN